MIELSHCIKAADELQLEPEIVLAVARVESNGDLNSFLFEPHVFSARTNQRWDKEYPAISYPVWDRNKYPKTKAGRENQFRIAVNLEPTKSYESASWGLFQIMGYHYKILRYPVVTAMVGDLISSIDGNIAAFCRFIRANGLQELLRDKEWAKFARAYNGPGYKINAYDLKMLNAYELIKRGHNQANV